jgi:DNA primase
VWRRIGVHVTYLSDDGRAKARLRDPQTGEALPARKILGGLEGGMTPLTGLAGLAVDVPGVPLVVGEGIETVWGGVQHLGLSPCRAAALLSLGNLQGQPLRDRDGAFDPRAARMDPARPAVTIPAAGDVVVLVDADMAPVTVRARQPGRRGVADARLGALERAELCAALAGQAWRRAGARSVRTPRPPLGQDFNDLVREEAGL